MTDFQELPDLASERLGGAVLWANDDFFAEKDNLLRAAAPVWKADAYTDRGKWMDGWESRRRRVPGHDECVVRLGLPGLVRGVVIDTAFFRGNFPDMASIDACVARPDATVDELLSSSTEWVELLPQVKLAGDTKNRFAIAQATLATHLRLHIYPDGGVARLRVHGAVMPDWRALGDGGDPIDLAALENGAVSIACSDMFFGERHNLILPGRAPNMGDGWETRRRRGPGFDWNLVELAAEGTLDRLVIDTDHFKGNYPDTCSVEGILRPGATADELRDAPFVEVLPRTKLQAHTRHEFTDALLARGPFTHLRLCVFPDGGVSRLRAWGRVGGDGLARARLARLACLDAKTAEAELLTACGASAFAGAVAAARPFASEQDLRAKADAALDALTPDGWLEAFRAHPRIGERAAAVATGEQAARFATGEQARAADASDDARAELARLNAEYEARHGFVFLIFASGRTAEELLAELRRRLPRSTEEELELARAEQRAITHLRLAKLLGRAAR